MVFDLDGDGKAEAIVARNTLLDLLGLAQPSEEQVPKEDFDTPAALLDEMVELAAAKGLFDGSVPQYRINFETRMMGALMPRESEVCRKFRKLYAKGGPKAATDWFYDLCVVSNYIRTAQIAKNIQWNTATPYGELEITINLTKPEKDPKVIAMERLQPAASYPKCMLCKENIGYAGRINFPARQTHRIVPINLAGETFYLQYSPYAYFHEHCIMLNDSHKPMEMDRHTLAEIFDFVAQFPHYTCGSNADLPIVGGSILSHSHFQGGRYVFPMQKAHIAVPLRNARYTGVKAGIVNWPVSTVRLVGRSSQEVQSAADDILRTWRDYSDTSVDIIAHTGDTPHNTVTPILHYDENDGYILDLALRNNRTTEQYPDGIFHPHKEYHNIKKENIGLIEVMGLAILPIFRRTYHFRLYRFPWYFLGEERKECRRMLHNYSFHQTIPQILPCKEHPPALPSDGKFSSLPGLLSLRNTHRESASHSHHRCEDRYKNLPPSVTLQLLHTPVFRM